MHCVYILFLCFCFLFIAFENDLKTLTDGPSIRDDILQLADNNVTFPKSDDFAKMLRSQHHVGYKIETCF